MKTLIIREHVVLDCLPMEFEKLFVSIEGNLLKAKLKRCKDVKEKTESELKQLFSQLTSGYIYSIKYYESNKTN